MLVISTEKAVKNATIKTCQLDNLIILYSDKNIRLLNIYGNIYDFRNK